MRRALALALVALVASSCAYYNTFYLARKYYFRATLGAPYELEPDANRQRANYDKAIDYSTKLIGNYAKSKWVDDAYVLWARALIGTGDPLKAVALLEEFPTKFPKSDLRPEAQFYLGLAQRSARKYNDAVATLDDFLAHAPKHALVPYALYEKANALSSLGRYTEAAQTAGILIDRFPKHELADRALRERAEARFQQGDYAGARADFHAIGERALTDDERFEFTLREVDCLEAARQYDDALAVLRDALSHVPPPPPPSQNQAAAPGTDRYGKLTLRMGGTLLLAGRTDQALERYRAVLEDYPKTQLGAEAQFRIGFAYETGADDFARAREEYAKVKDQTGQSQFVQQATQRLQNLDRIRQFATGGGADSLTKRAEADFLTAEHYLFQLGRPERALEEYQHVADRYPGTPVAARALNAEAWVLSRKLNRTADAHTTFWKVVHDYPATEAQLAARDYLEADGIEVPDSLIVPPKPAPAPAPADTARLTPVPPTPPLGSALERAVADSIRRAHDPRFALPPRPGGPVVPGLRPDSLGRSRGLFAPAPALAPDTSRARTDTSRTGRATADTSRTPASAPPAPPDTSRGSPR